ncbi:MAG: PulJ/GspJ family protein [Syntrophorhabdaceae bacterium]
MMRINDKGFTLIEIVTIIVIMGILGAFTLAFLNHAITMYSIGARQRMIYQEASYVMERITRELRDAAAVSAVTVVTAEKTTSSLTIKKSHTAGSMDNSSSVTFSWDSGSGNIVRTPGDRVMGRNVINFTPTPNSCSAGSNNCQVTISLQVTDPNIPIDNLSGRSITLTTSVSPRNFILSPTEAYVGRCFNGDYENIVQ